MRKNPLHYRHEIINPFLFSLPTDYTVFGLPKYTGLKSTGLSTGFFSTGYKNPLDVNPLVIHWFYQYRATRRLWTYGHWTVCFGSTYFYNLSPLDSIKMFESSVFFFLYYNEWKRPSISPLSILYTPLYPPIISLFLLTTIHLLLLLLLLKKV